MESKQNIHELGLNYLHDLLNNVGFTIHDVNKDLNHHFQLFAKVNDRALLIAVRTACHPDVGTIDKETQEKLIKESERLNAIPHFAGLSLKTIDVTDVQAEGMIEESEYNVIFNGMTVVR